MELEKIDPKFRILVDQLFFTDRMDLDLSDFALLLGDNLYHHNYLWDRFIRSSEIFWDELFWINRFEFLLEHKTKHGIYDIEPVLSNRLKRLLIFNANANPAIHNDYIHYIALTKAKINKEENIQNIKDFLSELLYCLPFPKLVAVISNFVPMVFDDTNSYIKHITKGIGHSERSFELIKEIENNGFVVDRTTICKTAKNLLFIRAINKSNRRALFSMMNDPIIMTGLKSEYDSKQHRERLINIIFGCDFREIEEKNLRNIKNILNIDPAVAEELLMTYTNKLYARGTGYKGANIKRLIRACKSFKQFPPKKILVYLATNNRMSDIKLLVAAFHELKPLLPFV